MNPYRFSLADSPLYFVKNTRNTQVFLRFLPHLRPNQLNENCMALKMQLVKMKFGGLRLQLGWRQAKSKTPKFASIINFKRYGFISLRLFFGGYGVVAALEERIAPHNAKYSESATLKNAVNLHGFERIL
jgi:hypothetical protein